jgi:hypothetical protein
MMTDDDNVNNHHGFCMSIWLNNAVIAGLVRGMLPSLLTDPSSRHHRYHHTINPVIAKERELHPGPIKCIGSCVGVVLHGGHLGPFSTLVHPAIDL